MFTQSISEKTRFYILRNSRLLERQIYSALFEGGSVEMCVKSIEAYQNSDGGFGNGIEPDLLTPISSGIGMETAFYYMDMLISKISRMDMFKPMLLRARDWVEHKLTESGNIPFLPEDVRTYPHQKWWLNPDETRILSLAGYLAKFNIPLRQNAKKVAGNFADSLAVPETLTEYNYPIFIYAVYETSFRHWEQSLDPKLCQKL